MESRSARLLDLYLDGSIYKDVYNARKAKLQVFLRDLKAQEARLKARIDDSALKEETIQTIVDFAKAV